MEQIAQETLERIFPRERSDEFFEALYGDKAEGAYDIELVFKGALHSSLLFEFHLKQRPGKCLACNLTYGLPDVFERHPVINLKGLLKEIEKVIKREIKGYKLGHTREMTPTLHVIPLELKI